MSAAIQVDLADAILDAICSAVDLTAPTEFWVQLHTGNPGVDGTANVAAETTRQQAAFNAASGGSADTSGDLDWTSVAASETWTYVSFWDASTSGTFLASDSLVTPRVVVMGDDATLPAGDLSVTLAPIAA